MMGNPEAASSAYSLYDYVIANELGGESAFENLKARAWKRGIRSVSYTHLRAHETVLDLVCRLLLEKKKKLDSASEWDHLISTCW